MADPIKKEERLLELVTYAFMEECDEMRELQLRKLGFDFPDKIRAAEMEHVLMVSVGFDKAMEGIISRWDQTHKTLSMMREIGKHDIYENVTLGKTLLDNYLVIRV